MKKVSFLFTIVIVILSVQLLSAQTGLHRLGLLREDPRGISWLKPAEVEVTRTLPSTFFNPAYLPPIGNQGSQGSCTAWAVAYYFKTYQEAKDRQWDPALPEHQASPAFVYNLINGGKDGGSFISDAFKALEDFGCGTMADMPYNAGNFSDWPSEDAFENGIPFRTQNTAFIYTANNAGINQIKQVLNNGELLVIGISVYPNFDNISSFDYTYCVNDVYGSIRGGHAVTIIGYDDSKVTHDGVGAFRMVNSWGRSWGQSGFWWMSYEAVKSSLLCHGFAYYANDRPHYTPELVARYQITHPRRGTVGVTVGVGTTMNSLWSHHYFDFQMWQYSIDNHSYPHNPVLLDASDGASYLTPGSSNNFYIEIHDQKWDGQSGTIDFFRGEFNAQQMTATATNLPLSIPDGSLAPVGVPIGGAFSIFPLSIQFGEIMMGTPVQQDIEFNNMGNSSESFVLQMDPGSSPDFTFTADTVALAPGESQTISVQYFPLTQGNDKGKINATGTIFSTAIRMRGNATGTLSLDPAVFDFGQVPTGSSQSTQFTVKNFGNQTEQINLAITGAHPGHFLLSTPQLTLAAGDSQSVTVTFKPQSAEEKIAYLEVSTPAQVHHATLLGYGIGVSQLQTSVSSLDKSVLFGDSMLAVLQLENSGSSALSFTASLDFGSGSSGWAEVQNPTGNITPGGSKKVFIRLRGTTAGVDSAEIEISTNEPNSPVHQIPLHLKVNQVNEPEHFVPCYSGAPYQPMTIRIIHAERGGEELEAGDEIAVYDGSLCVGTARLHFTVGGGTNALGIVSSEDDPATTPIDGFSNGDQISFKVWDYSEGSEFPVTDVEFVTTGGQPVPAPPFAGNSMAIARLGMITGIEAPASGALATSFTLEQNYPNPFNPTTTIRFSLPGSGFTTLTIFNSLGQTVRTLVRKNLPAGEYDVVWDSRNRNGEPVSSGVYLYRLQFEKNGTQKLRTGKMLLLR